MGSLLLFVGSAERLAGMTQLASLVVRSQSCSQCFENLGCICPYLLQPGARILLRTCEKNLS